MKILLCLPRFEPNANPPLGLAYIAAVLRQRKFDVEILDPTFENFDFAVKRLEKADFDILGISCFTMNYNVSKKLAAIAKKANPNLLAVFGGPHPSILPEETIKDKEVDAVCIGEGEETFAELAERLSKKKSLKGIKGLWFKQGKKTVKNARRPMIEDLDSIPFPARDLIPMQKYLKAVYGTTAWAVKQPSTTITAGRGCPFNCTYCSTKLVYGLNVRFRSAKNIIAEIELLVKDYGIKGMNFIDDTFTINKKLIFDFCDSLAGKKLDVQWACHTRVNNVSLEMLKKMKAAGCTCVGMGVESGNQFVLDNYIKKGINLEQAVNAFKWAKQAGLITDAYFMIGIPGETKEQMRETINFAKKLDLDVVNFSITRPMPKTEMMEIALRQGSISAKDWDDYDFSAKPIYHTDAWNMEELRALQKQAYRSFYFRPSFVLKQALSIRSVSDLKNKINGLKMVLKT
ncbi:MAG: radical SAM protein [Candidatus Diapherotrites archaeon]|nr:radical SAM protein [Candidatus Diapherotrites archaeon]